MTEKDFLLRVRGAGPARVFRFRGAEATELHRLRDNGTLERPGGSHRLNQLIQGRQPDDLVPGAGTFGEDVHFDMVAEDQLRQYMSSRVLERRRGREADPPAADTPVSDRPNDLQVSSQ